MRLLKNMDVVLMLVFGVVCAAVLFTPARATRPAGPAQSVVTVSQARTMQAMPTVHVSGHRIAPQSTASLPARTLQDGVSSLDED